MSIFAPSGILYSQIPDLEFLGAREFKKREVAETRIVNWALEEKKEERMSTLLNLYFQDSDPESSERLRKIIFRVKYGKLEKKTNKQGFLGIQMQNTRHLRRNDLEIPNGVRITQVVAGTPADTAGIKNGDIIVRIDDIQFEDRPDPSTILMAYVAWKEPGDEIRLSLKRGKETVELSVKLMNRDQTHHGPAKSNLNLLNKIQKAEFYNWLDEQRKFWAQ